MGPAAPSAPLPRVRSKVWESAGGYATAAPQGVLRPCPAACHHLEKMSTKNTGIFPDYRYSMLLDKHRGSHMACCSA
ncbi:hypothetical protein Y1Q_0001188 [Alligator mississippiensis]|uniref:Uncharacterized protein n=1 Tax=Alligator mississippiensis TaxID=8496 RepID=A0A151PEB8_ALLMI|nr:hypothetical protein Y1Q_0001188 [Alligator mississippiensis]